MYICMYVLCVCVYTHLCFPSISLSLSFPLHLDTPMSPYFGSSIGGLGGAQATKEREDGRYAVGTTKT